MPYVEMPLIQQKSDELEQLINESVAFEGRHYLLHLYDALVNSEKPFEEIEPIADQLIALIKNINEIKDPEISSMDQAIAIQNLIQNYNHLIAETGFQGVFYTSKSVLLGLGGIILGLIAGVLGAAVGLLILGVNDLIHFRLPTGTLIGAIAGLLVGYTIGQNIPQKLFSPNEVRILQDAVGRLENSFHSLFLSRHRECVEEIKKELLEEYFDNNQEAFDRYLKEPQKYEILSIEAPFISDRLRGSLGHHSFIKLSINNSEKAQLIEIGNPSDKEVNFSQREIRETTGEGQIHMLAMHRILKPQYEISIGNLFNLLSKYSACKHDCHTYVDIILESAGEPKSHILRFTENDTLIGRCIARTMRFFIPFSEAKEQFTSSCELIQNGP